VDTLGVALSTSHYPKVNRKRDALLLDYERIR